MKRAPFPSLATSAEKRGRAPSMAPHNRSTAAGARAWGAAGARPCRAQYRGQSRSMQNSQRVLLAKPRTAAVSHRGRCGAAARAGSPGGQASCPTATGLHHGARAVRTATGADHGSGLWGRAVLSAAAGRVCRDCAALFHIRKSLRSGSCEKVVKKLFSCKCQS